MLINGMDVDPEDEPDASARTDVFALIDAERERQDAQWGGPAHDDAHGFEDWSQFRFGFEQKIRHDAFAPGPFAGDQWVTRTHDNLVKIAALAVAQLESLRRMHPHLAAEPALPPVSTRETLIMLLLTSEGARALDAHGEAKLTGIIDGWTQDQREEASRWAGAVHVHASDHDDVVVPKIPAHVRTLVPRREVDGG